MEKEIKIYEVLIAEYATKGHPSYPEDTWEMEREIANENEFYNFVIEIHKRDARSFNGYPLGGGCPTCGGAGYLEY